jgi:transcriptional regulator with XRE-family HTH domain
MPDNAPLSLLVPQDIMLAYAKRVRTLRIQFGITQKELAQRVGVAEGTIKRFEWTGEIQLRSLLAIALVLGRLDEFANIFKLPDVPTSLYKPEKKPLESRRRARKKCV